MADRDDLEFTYSLIDRIFRLSLGELADFSGAKYDGDFSLSLEQAQRRKHDYVGEQIGIDWATAPFDVEQFRAGMDVELEHGLHDLATNVTGDDEIVTGKIALAHLNEFPDYYTRLERMEEEAKREHGSA